jgi:FkbM family methyltransferase
MVSIKNPLKFFKKANKSFNLYLKSHKNISKFLKDYSAEKSRKNAFLKDYQIDSKRVNAFLDDYYQKIPYFQEYISNKKAFNQSIDIINEYYSKNKDYFFNGEENLFKDVMNTDHFFQMCFFNDIELLSYSLAETRIYLKTKDNIILCTNNRFLTIDTIFGKGEYSSSHLHKFNDFVVFDVGMNRGYAALKFANFDSCKAVYGFEIDPDTYDFALENFRLNPRLSSKIRPYNFGLYNKTTELDLYYIPGYDGISTTKIEFAKTQTEWLREKEKMQSKKAQVKQAGMTILDIIKNENITSNIVLKIDTEGAEHKIIDDIISKGLLDKIDLIMGEIHLEDEDLDVKLKGFKKISKIYTKDGKIYSFCFVRDKYFKPLPRADTN